MDTKTPTIDEYVKQILTNNLHKKIIMRFTRRTVRLNFGQYVIMGGKDGNIDAWFIITDCVGTFS